MNKPTVSGVGYNDSPYKVSKGHRVNGVWKNTWRCPYYKQWENMLSRCYNTHYKKTRKTYEGCTVNPSWHHFMDFRNWMQERKWQGLHLDKDLLVEGNKEYGPETCIFVTSEVNSLFLTCGSRKGEYPIGVHLHKPTGRFMAQASLGPGTNRSEGYIGYFDTPHEAHEAWLERKTKRAVTLAMQQECPVIRNAILRRVESLGQPTE